MQEQYQRSLTPLTIDQFESKWKTPFYLTKKQIKDSPPISTNEVQTHRKQHVPEKENRQKILSNITSEYINLPISELFQQVEFLIKNIFDTLGNDILKNVKDLRIQLERTLKRLEFEIKSDNKMDDQADYQNLKMKLNEQKNKLKVLQSEQKQEIYQLKKQVDSQKSIILMREEENAYLRKESQEERQKIENLIDQLRKNQNDRRRDSYSDQSEYIQMLQGQISGLKDEKSNLLYLIKNQGHSNDQNNCQSNVVKDLQHRINETNKQLEQLTNYLMQQQRTESEQQHQLSDTIKKFEQRLNHESSEESDKKMQDLIEANQMLQQQLAANKKHMSDLHSQMEMQSHSNQEFRQQSNQVAYRVYNDDKQIQLEAIIQNLNEKLMKSKNQLVNEINQKEIIEQEFEEKVRTLGKKIDDLQLKSQQKELLSEELKQNEQLIKSLQNKVKSLQNQYNDIKMEQLSYQSQLVKKQKEFEDLKSEYSSLQQLYNEQVMEFKQLVEENARRYNSAQLIRNELQSKDRKYKQLQKRMKSEQENNSKFTEILLALKQINLQSNSFSDKQALISQLEFIKNQYEQLQKDYSELQNVDPEENNYESELLQKNGLLQRQEVQIQMLKQQLLIQRGSNMTSLQLPDLEIKRVVLEIERIVEELQRLLQDQKLYEANHEEFILGIDNSFEQLLDQMDILKKLVQQRHESLVQSSRMSESKPLSEVYSFNPNSQFN